MKKILIRSARVLFPDSPFYKQKADVLIEGGKISAVAETILPEQSKGSEIIEAEGKYLSPGFFDLNASFGEPGDEPKETIESGTAAALAGGFTGLALQSLSKTAIQTRSEVLYLINQARHLAVDIHPVGAVTVNREGKDITELFDMYQAGAKAFSDGTKAINDAGLMSRALLYVKNFGGLIFSFPEDRAIAGSGRMNEGRMSTYLGMKGVPVLAEELMVSRDLYLAEYNDTKLHFSTISCKGSVDLIRAAKKKGLKVTCDVAAHHLVLTEDVLEHFDTNYKVKPPLRAQEDVDALLAGLEDGVIDAVVSQHTPHEVEFKDVEFEIAANGIIGLQTVLPLLVRSGFHPETIVEKIAVRPRAILGIPLPNLVVGSDINFVLFDTHTEWVFDKENNRSMSANSPFIEDTLKGKVFVVGNKSQLFVS